MKYILDASVVLSFLLEKNKNVLRTFKLISDEVQSGKSGFYAPTFLDFEVANVIRYRISNTDEAMVAFNDFVKIGQINYFELSKEHLREIMRLAFLKNVAIYDMSYHYIAKLLDGVFLTCDANYFKKANEIGSIQLV